MFNCFFVLGRSQTVTLALSLSISGHHQNIWHIIGGIGHGGWLDSADRRGSTANDQVYEFLGKPKVSISYPSSSLAETTV